jgi:Ca2+-transporting ATPase
MLLRGGSTVDMVAPPLALSCAHWLPAEACLDSLQVSEVIGLSTEEASVRFSYYGPNSLPAPPTRTLLSLVLEQFEDRLVQILLSVAVLSAFLAFFENDAHAFAEPFIILSILVLNAFVGIWQSKSAEDSLDALKKLQPENACVLRDGVWNGSLSAAEIVPGDILYLRVGDRVPADARVIHLKTNTFSTDEGSLTGESLTVSKYTTPVDVNVPISGKTNMVRQGLKYPGNQGTREWYPCIDQCCVSTRPFVHFCMRC